MSRVKQVTIIGLGLIGGSLGMAMKRRHLAGRVIGWSRKSSTLRQAKRRGAIDVGTTDLARAVQGADLVVIATPVDAIVPIAQRVARWMTPGSILTDVGSVKGAIVQPLERMLPRHIRFVGGHPLAGSEQRGIRAACGELFEDSTCILTATNRTNRQAVRAVMRLWKPLVRRVVVMESARHDRLLAAVSHVPHLLAFALVNATDGAARAIAPRSFLDATRVAQSDPALWDEIFFSNRAALLAAMKSFERHWHVLQSSLSRGNRAALLHQLATAQARRHALHDRSR